MTVKRSNFGHRMLACIGGLVIGWVMMVTPVRATLERHNDGDDRLQPWDNCTVCHGADLNGGIGPACTTCHQDFSEPDLPPTGHHQEGRQDPFTNCVLCHGNDLTGNIGPSCFQCHDQLWPDGGGPNSPPDVKPGGPYVGIIGVPVQFDASATTDADGDTLTFIWDFGDGSFPSVGGTGVASHVYTAVGDYTATLAVSDTVGLPVSVQVTVTITEENQPPTADTGGPYSGTEGEPIALDGSGSTDTDGDPLTYEWDFGDGSAVAGPGSQATISHTYAAAGSYILTLKVSDGINDPVIASTDVEVAEGDTGGGTPPLPPTGDYWDMRYPLLGTVGTAQFQDFGPWMLVTHAVDGGVDIQGIGFWSPPFVMWMDLEGAIFVGTVNDANTQMSGIVLNLLGSSSSVWFAQPHGMLPPDDGSGGAGDGTGGDTSGGSGTGGDTSGGSGTGGDTSGGSGTGGDTSGGSGTGGDTSGGSGTGGDTSGGSDTTSSDRPTGLDLLHWRSNR